MIDAAIILAGGKGTRLAPETSPKCLTHVHGRRIIERLLEHVAPHVKRTIICVGYRASDVEAALRDKALLFSNVGEDATMVERLLAARRSHSVTGRALILYGDHLADVDIPKLEAHHETNGAQLTFTAHRYRLPFGTVHGSRIFNDEDVLMNIGFVLVDAPAWKYAIATDGLSEWANRVSGATCFIHEGRSTSINNHAEHAIAESVWK